MTTLSRQNVSEAPEGALPNPRAGVVTFLFSDIEGSTRLWERYPDVMPGALARHDFLLQRAIEAGGGVVFKKGGDSFCAAFSQAHLALGSALAAQISLKGENWNLPDGHTPRIRVALHTGQAEQREGDYFGVSLSRTARLLAAAHGGQTLVSESSAALLMDSLPEGIRLHLLGRHRLKDLAQPLDVFQMGHPALPDEFPPLRSLESFAHNLPGQLTSFIGREHEMAEARRLLLETRLLSLTGTGGAGKSRLAMQVAADALEDYPDGVWLVELAALSDPALVLQAVASVLGVGEESDRPLRDTLTAALRSKSLLLIFDNCEHLVESCAHLAEDLLRACPRLRLLATSREALEISGETVLPVPSLAIPAATGTFEVLAKSESVRLFVDRATAALPVFRLSAGNSSAIAQICARLDGIPLALELAAARVKVLTPEQISARLDDRFRLLTGGSRTAGSRQQTLRALIDWSYDLLLPAEQLLLRRLSVFSGGLSLEAAEAVCAGGEIDELDVLDLISRLVAKSLVVVEPPEDGQVRYHLQENLRQYARQRLVETEEEQELGACHRDFFLSLAEEAEIEIKGPQQVSWLNRLERDHDNFRAALRLSLESPDLNILGIRMASALYRFWYVRGYLSEGLRWLETALGSSGDLPDDLHAKACTAAGVLTWSLGDTLQARTYHQKSLDLYRRMQAPVGIARSLANLGLVASQEKKFTLARDFFEESLALYRQVGTPNDVALMLNNLGTLLSDLAENEAARPYLEESLLLSRTSQDEKLITASLYNLGALAESLKNYPEAAHYYLENLVRQKEFGEKQGIALTLRALARIAEFCGFYDMLTVLLAMDETFAKNSGLPSLDPEAAGDAARSLNAAQAALGTDYFQFLWSQGRQLTLEQAIDYTLEQSKTLMKSAIDVHLPLT